MLRRCQLDSDGKGSRKVRIVEGQEHSTEMEAAGFGPRLLASRGCEDWSLEVGKGSSQSLVQ